MPVRVERFTTFRTADYDEALESAGITGRPVAVLDLDAFEANLASLKHRARGLPVRVASKSLRVQDLIDRSTQAFGGGVLAYSLGEAIDLVKRGYRDVVVAYPQVDPTEIRDLAANDVARDLVTVMIDSLAHAQLISNATAAVLGARESVRVAVELDCSFTPLRGIHLGAWRSPLRTPEEVRNLVAHVERVPRVRVVGLMGYEAQIAGTVNRGRNPVRVLTRAMQAVSSRDVNGRRARTVELVREVADLEFVNGGGTGSIELTAADPSVTEVAAGSGLIGPTIFDHFHAFAPRPALFLGFPVVRRPSKFVATIASGGWIASGPVGLDRNPTPVSPAGLAWAKLEGAGEVQSPLIGPSAEALRIGDTVWMRHAKAGEPAERINEYVLVSGATVVGRVPTYRGERRAYG